MNPTFDEGDDEDFFLPVLGGQPGEAYYPPPPSAASSSIRPVLTPRGSPLAPPSSARNLGRELEGCVGAVQWQDRPSAATTPQGANGGTASARGSVAKQQAARAPPDATAVVQARAGPGLQGSICVSPHPQQARGPDSARRRVFHLSEAASQGPSTNGTLLAAMERLGGASRGGRRVRMVRVRGGVHSSFQAGCAATPAWSC